MQVLALSSNGRKESDRCGLPDDRADRFVVFERSSFLEPRLAMAGEVAWRLIRRGEPALGELGLRLVRCGERECCLPIGELRAELGPSGLSYIESAELTLRKLDEDD